MTAVLLALAVIVAGIAMFSRNRVRSAVAAPEKSIAVLPFENLSRRSRQRLFCRRRSERNPNPAREDRCAQGHLTHVDTAISFAARQSE